MTDTKWTKRYLIGKHNDESIYLKAPSWDCGWYWGFGYLGNNNCHYHLDSFEETKENNLYDAIKKHFTDHIFIDDAHLWTFCELVKTAYSLKETAEVLGRGGSHFTSNPCADIIKNEAEVKRINEIVLPAIFDAIGRVLEDATALKETISKNPENGDYIVLSSKYYPLQLETKKLSDAKKLIEHQKAGNIDVSEYRIVRLIKGFGLIDIKTHEKAGLLNNIFTKESFKEFEKTLIKKAGLERHYI